MLLFNFIHHKRESVGGVMSLEKILEEIDEKIEFIRVKLEK